MFGSFPGTGLGTRKSTSTVATGVMLAPNMFLVLLMGLMFLTLILATPAEARSLFYS